MNLDTENELSKEKNEKFSKIKFATTVRILIVDINMVRGSPRNLLRVGTQLDRFIG